MKWYEKTALNVIIPFGFRNLAESMVDNHLKPKVSPVRGSIIYCELALGHAEHSGVYVGNGRVVHLDGSGRIENVSCKEFMQRLGGWNTARSIYVSCNEDNEAVGSYGVAYRALAMVGSNRNYQFIGDNCHRFTSDCINHQSDTNENFLWMLKLSAQKALGADRWLVMKN